jgi:putative phosphoribosyl transferase
MLVGRRVQSPHIAFADRGDAGRQLTAFMAAAPNEDAIVLALPRGGVPVGRAFADALKAPLQLAVVRKLAVPSSPEMGFGAIAPDGAVSLNEAVVDTFHLGQEEIDRAIRETRAEVRRRAAGYGATEETVLRGASAYLVDDGLATGWSMLAALSWARDRQAARTIVAVPVAPLATLERLTGECDSLICLYAQTPGAFAVASYYRDFHDLTDDEVRSLL